MNIKEFFATLGIQLDKEDFDEAEKALDEVKEGLEWVATGAIAATAALGAMILSTAQEASEITKLATLMGVSTDQAQEWAYAAQQSGLSADDLGQLVAELAENLGEAAGGTGEAADAFKSLGLSLKDSNGKLKETPVALAEIADKLSTMADGQQKTAAITGLFGEEGIKLLAVLNKGSAGLEQYAQEARDLGLIMNRETVESGKELSANLNTLKSTVTALAAQVAGPFIRDLNELFKSLRMWWMLNGRLVGQQMEAVLGGVVDVIRLLARALLLLSKALKVVIDNFSLFAILAGSVLTAIFIAQLKWHLLLLSSWLSVGKAALWSGMQAMWAWIKAAAPIIAIAALIALVVLLFEDIYFWITGGNSLLAQLWGRLKAFLAEWVKPKAGDGWLVKGIKGALDLVMNFGTYWDAMIQAIRNAWNGAVIWMEESFYSMINKVIDGINYALDFIPGNEGRTVSHLIREDDVRDAAIASAAVAGLEAFSQGWRSLGASTSISPLATSNAKTLNDNRTMTVKVEGLDGKEAAEKFIEAASDWFGGVLSDAKGAK